MTTRDAAASYEEPPTKEMPMSRTATWSKSRSEQLDLLQAFPRGEANDGSAQARLSNAERRIKSLEEALASSTTLNAVLDTALYESKRAQARIALENTCLRQALHAARETRAHGGDVQAFIRDLLKIAHPDKWSQGQLATELAHELSVQLTARMTRR